MESTILAHNTKQAIAYIRVSADEQVNNFSLEHKKNFANKFQNITLKQL